MSLPELVAALEAVKATPSLEQIYGWLENADLSQEELQPYLGFKEGNYWRHRVYRNEFVEMLVLCWRPGQRTPIHDHNGSHGGVKIWDGHLWETIFTYDAVSGLQYERGREHQARLRYRFRYSGHSPARQSGYQRTGSSHSSHLCPATRRSAHLQTRQREDRSLRARRLRSGCVVPIALPTWVDEYRTGSGSDRVEHSNRVALLRSRRQFLC